MIKYYLFVKITVEAKKVLIKMNTEITKDLLNQAKSLANTEELRTLIDNLEQFMNLQVAPGKEIEISELTQKWRETREKLWESFEKVSAMYGITPEMIREKLENPENFLGEHKETLQQLKDLEEASSTKIAKKIKARA